jgi:hypothetical protein
VCTASEEALALFFLAVYRTYIYATDAFSTSWPKATRPSPPLPGPGPGTGNQALRNPGGTTGASRAKADSIPLFSSFTTRSVPASSNYPHPQSDRWWLHDRENLEGCAFGGGARDRQGSYGSEVFEAPRRRSLRTTVDREKLPHENPSRSLIHRKPRPLMDSALHFDKNRPWQC